MFVLEHSWSFRLSKEEHPTSFTSPLLHPSWCSSGRCYTGEYSLPDRATREYPVMFETLNVLFVTFVFNQSRITSFSPKSCPKFSNILYRLAVVMFFFSDHDGNNVYDCNPCLPSDIALLKRATPCHVVLFIIVFIALHQKIILRNYFFFYSLNFQACILLSCIWNFSSLFHIINSFSHEPIY